MASPYVIRRDSAGFGNSLVPTLRDRLDRATSVRDVAALCDENWDSLTTPDILSAVDAAARVLSALTLRVNQAAREGLPETARERLQAYGKGLMLQAPATTEEEHKWLQDIMLAAVADEAAVAPRDSANLANAYAELRTADAGRHPRAPELERRILALLERDVGVMSARELARALEGLSWWRMDLAGDARSTSRSQHADVGAGLRRVAQMRFALLLQHPRVPMGPTITCAGALTRLGWMEVPMFAQAVQAVAMEGTPLSLSQQRALIECHDVMCISRGATDLVDELGGDEGRALLRLCLDAHAGKGSRGGPRCRGPRSRWGGTCRWCRCRRTRRRRIRCGGGCATWQRRLMLLTASGGCGTSCRAARRTRARTSSRSTTTTNRASGCRCSTSSRC
ncbi:unnamed protein product [Pedinophyceae sp. YPF-701]|nr:unnamed protein product [Pedinophyceae sp. YPF-701]